MRKTDVAVLEWSTLMNILANLDRNIMVEGLRVASLLQS